MNVMLLIIGFLTCGKEFGVKTIYTSIMLPVFWEYMKSFSGLSVHDRKPGAGCSLLHSGCERRLQYSFNRNASSGGLDIVAKIMNKYLHMELGKAISLSGMCIALSAALVYDKKSVVLSVLGTYFNGLLLDHFILDRISSGECALLQNMKKNSEILFFIICTAGQRFTRLWALTIWKTK